MTAAVAHAARQLVWHVRAPSLTAPAWLIPSERLLFARMCPADRLEGLRVCRALSSWGYGSDRSLLVAGLLHDVGKSLAPPSAVWRVALTALEALVPAGLLAQLPGPMGTLARHASAGAKMAAEAGMSQDVVALIAGHHGLAENDRMAALQRADGLY
ncbi:MAG: HDIG domain-containing protein [Chloroflexi bacterium]|nr:HDIG domain-containing protein [Chloroflexota bacterium]